jgi:hypothetical protein
MKKTSKKTELLLRTEVLCNLTRDLSPEELKHVVGASGDNCQGGGRCATGSKFQAAD